MDAHFTPPAGDEPPPLTDETTLDDRTGPTLHPDLGQIAATEADGITINRTKRGTSPFVPIVKTPNYAQNSGNLTGFSVEMEDPDEKTGFRHIGNVSAGYLLLTNEEVRRLALEIAESSNLPYRESRIFWDGARFCHVVDFMETEEITDGDEVGLSLITRSSYDCSWRYECALMGKRFACDNGLLSGEFFARVSFKHLKASSNPDRKGEDGQWKEIVREGLSVLDRAPDDLYRFARGLRILKNAPMTDKKLRALWPLFPTIGDSIKGQIMSRYLSDEEPTLHGFLNAGTNVFWHRERMTAADFAHNDAFTTALLQFSEEHLN